MKVARSVVVSTALLSLSMILSSLASLAQTSAVRARVTQAVDMQNLVTLRGNVHPLARPEFDQGVAPDDLPMERMLLVLQRGADQEAALRQVARPAAGEVLSAVSPVADARAIRAAIWPRRFRPSGGHRLARVAGLRGDEGCRGPHGHRVFRHGGLGAASRWERRFTSFG